MLPPLSSSSSSRPTRSLTALAAVAITLALTVTPAAASPSAMDSNATRQQRVRRALEFAGPLPVAAGSGGSSFKDRVLPIVLQLVNPSQPESVLPLSKSVTSAENDEEDEDDVDEEEDNEGSDDHPTFNKPCSFVSTYHTCGDFASPVTSVHHGLFCSPGGICAGQGAACGSSEACAEGLLCNFQTHRCVSPSSSAAARLSRQADQRRASTAHASCPSGFEACPNGTGGFECVDTSSDVNECGACRSVGGERCYERPGALASSCRDGHCVVHACAGGWSMRPDGQGCEEDDDQFV